MEKNCDLKKIPALRTTFEDRRQNKKLNLKTYPSIRTVFEDKY
jgi:uncharacterized pyridoxamine 5'-phosphate oxidase family protein